MKTVITKGRYAALKGRAPSCVSNWITDGKISAAALVGEGQRARIWVEQADADLARNLDPSQQSYQAHPVSGSAPSPPPSDAPLPLVVAPARQRGGSNEDDDDLRRRRKADADKAEHDAEAARRKLAIDEGRWLDAADARREWSKELSALVSATETFLFTTAARHLAEEYGLDWKELATKLRALYRQHRGQIASEAASRRQVMEAMAEAAE